MNADDPIFGDQKDAVIEPVNGPLFPGGTESTGTTTSLTPPLVPIFDPMLPLPTEEPKLTPPLVPIFDPMLPLPTEEPTQPTTTEGTSNVMYFPIYISVGTIPAPTAGPFIIDIDVKPAIPSFQDADQDIPTSITIRPIPVKMRSAIMGIVDSLLNGKVENFYDIERELKTVLNFGGDYQALITNWQYDPREAPFGSALGGAGQRFLVKLYRPLPDEVEEKTQLWISRELAPTLIDRLFINVIPAPPQKVYLRPANKNVSVDGRSGVGVSNVTMAKLFTTGAFDPIRPTDPVLEEWYTGDAPDSELNIDYSDYRNFIFYSSAVGRLNAFANKMKVLENLDGLLAQQSSSLAAAGQIITGSLPYPVITKYAEQRLSVIQSFDPYERFLYYEENRPYSASLTTNHVQDAVYENDDSTWPKVSGSVLPASTVVGSVWWSDQMNIASEYDRENPNYLANNIPEYVKRDEKSEEFITFLNMIGHQFDSMKSYVDHMTDMYSRDSDPAEGLSADIVWNVARSLGIDLPNQYAIKSLIDYTVGEVGVVTPKVYRQVAAETWKRFLHNQIFMMKSKGTKTSLRALTNAYGILPSLLTIRESATPGFLQPEKTFETYEEQTNALNVTAGAYVQVPWSSSADIKTVEVRFATTTSGSLTLLEATGSWGLVLETTSGSYGKVILKTTTQTGVSSSVLPIFSGDYYSAMIRKSGSLMELQVKRAEADDIVEQSSTIESTSIVGAKFNSGSVLKIGTDSSTFGSPFVGLVDEFRVWSEYTTDDTFNLHVKYPGMYNGNTYTSARDSLIARLSFSKTKNLFGGATLPNETPYASASANLVTSGFANYPTAPHNMSVITREVTRYTPNVGSVFTTNKVIIAEPPTLVYMSGSSVPVLQRDRSIVSNATKQDFSRSTNTIGFYFSPTEAINDSIIRSVGNLDLHNYIGDPSDQYKESYADLAELSELYWTHYAYGFNQNSFIEFVENLLNPLFKQARQLVPARAKLLSGIVHESHILERAKIAHKPLQMSAGQYGRNEDTQNLEAVPLTSQPTVLEGADISYDTTFELDQQYDLSVLYSDYTASLTTDDVRTVSSENLFYTASYSLANSGSHVTSSYVMIDDYTNALNNQQNYMSFLGISNVLDLSVAQRTVYNQFLIKNSATVRIWGSIEDTIKRYPVNTYTDGTLVIEPYTDFTKIESYNYFDNPNGTVAVDQINYVRVNQAILRDRGIWVKGTVYSRNDYVIQTGSVGDAETGNGSEFRCISPDMAFTSSIDPYLDTRNWTAMTYTPVLTASPRKATMISGSISLVPTTSALTAFTGYDVHHFKFTRDYRRGVINHQYMGCLQDDSTTTDGKPAVEVISVVGDKLTVTNPGEPIQSNQNQSGPILDVT
jgi:hypothetical protein